jgi:hypothetical protein
MSDIILKSGDIVLTRGTAFISKAIRFFQRNKGEDISKVNHTGTIAEDSDLKNAQLIEALATVKCHSLMEQYGGKKCKVAIFRKRNLREDERVEIASKAKSYVGKKYGVIKIVGHALDWCIGGKYVFRRMLRMDDYPICSWVVGYAYAEIGVKFKGVEPWACQPDDIWDACIDFSKYDIIYPLCTLGDV